MSEDDEASELANNSLMAGVVGHLESRAEEICTLLVDAYKAEIADYRSLPEGFIDRDVAEMARRNLFTLLSWLSGDVEEVRSLEDFRNSAVRRFRQGVSVQSLLHAYRVWGQVVWSEVSKLPECQASPTTGFAVAGEVMRYVNRVSLAVANSYLEESENVIQDRQLAERDVLEELISGHPLSARVNSYLARLGMKLGQQHCVFLLRRSHSADTEPHLTRDSLVSVRRILPSNSPQRPLVGVREDEIVVVLHASDVGASEIREIANDLATDVAGMVVGVSRVHAGESGVATAYREAADAVRIASSNRERRAYFYTDVLLQTVVEKSGLRTAILSETVGPLSEYDRRNGSEMVETLQTYISQRFNLTRTANQLNVRPNTVRYRLERINDIAGRDTNQPDDLILLALGAKIARSWAAGLSLDDASR